MRLSSWKSDPGYHPYTYNVKVFLDGVEQRYAFIADEEQGFVVLAAVGEQGDLKFDKVGGNVLTTTLFGVVQIVVPFGFRNFPRT